MEVLVNDKPKSGKLLKDVISGEPYVEGANIVIIKGVKTKVEEESKKYRILTTKGPMILVITEHNETVEFWNKNYKSFENKTLRWKGVSDLAFGAITIDLNVSADRKKLKKWDVVLSISGLDKTEGHLVFIRKDVEEVYGLENPKIGILIGGKRVLSNLKPEDKIISIEPLRESKEEIDYFVTNDLNTELQDGWKIYTYSEAEFDGPPKSVEHSLAIMEDGYFEVTEHTNTYVTDCRLQTLLIDEENFEDRDRGVISVRNTGTGVGKVYIYKENRVSTLSHTIVGKITKGMDLVDFSDSGIITVLTKPERLNAIGKTQKEAEELFKKHNIKHNLDGITDEDAIIVDQNPEYTMDIIKNGEVTTKGISPDDILYIKIFDEDAPVTAWYFRKTTGLTTKRIGKLKVYLSHKDMAMFERNLEYAKGLLPENTPKETLDGGYIAVTNMVKKYKGYIGVRLSKSDKYGPTGESFEGTNVVAKIVKNSDILKRIKSGDTLYILEVKD